MNKTQFVAPGGNNRGHLSVEKVMKKIISTLLIAFCGVCAAMASIDDWRYYTPFSGADRMAETRGRVYFTSAGSLFAYDKSNDETLAFSFMNDLNDPNDVTGVFAPFNGNYVVVAYSNGNMDVLRDDGSVVNLPDIKDSRMTDKRINNATFSDDQKTMLVATAFGIVRYNMVKLEVIDSGIYNDNVDAAAIIGGFPVAIVRGYVCVPPTPDTLRDLGYWWWQPHGVEKVVTAGGTTYAIVDEDGVKRPAILHLDPETRLVTKQYIGTREAEGMASGTAAEPIAIASGTQLTMADAEGNVTSTHTLPEGFNNSCFTAAGGPADLWTGSRQGVSNADAKDTYIYPPVKPGELSVRNVHILASSTRGDLYMSNRGNSLEFGTSGGNTGYQSVRTPDGVFHDSQPHGLDIPPTSTRPSPEGYLFDPLFVTPSVTNPGIYYTGNLSAGVFAIDALTGRQLVHFTPDNSPLPGYWNVRDAAFDSSGTLWLFSETSNANPPSLIALSPQGVAKMDKVSKDDWAIGTAAKSFFSARDGQIATGANGRLLYLLGDNKIGVYDTKGTATVSDDSFVEISRFRMADGSGFPELQRFHKLMEDPLTGALWVATNDGVIVVPEPTKVSGGIVDIVRPKVARNDGTGLADYLLSTQAVFNMAIDGAGHKWFVTRESGIFMTSADGTQILQNFTAANSPIPSNTVFSVKAHPAWADKIYFGTTNGLLEYRSGYSQPSDNLNDVLIYPNPVKPDYTGPITIQGLVDASRVKILSPGGLLVAELTSDGGTVRWSGNGTDGKRVPAGVYHVLASSQDKGAKPVGKIVVIR